MWRSISKSVSQAVKRVGQRVNAAADQRTYSVASSSEASVKFALQPYKTFKLETNKLPGEVTLTRDDALRMLRQMQLIRRIETAASGLYKEKAIRGFLHLYSGQEAIVVGMYEALDAQRDDVITAYRDHGYAICAGVDSVGVLAELTGRETGCAGGRGGSMHMYAPGFFGGNGIVGAQVPVGAGLALANKMRGRGGVCVTAYGDGAANQGQVFEAFNMAKLWQLPCIFVCENNKYGMGTAVDRASANTEYYTRGDYIPGLWVDGMCAVSVREAFRFAREWCASGMGPLLLEAETYRYHGHSMSDPGTSYRSREEVQHVRKGRDPISGFASQLQELGLLTEQEVKECERAAKQEVDAAVQRAKSDALPPPEHLFADIFVEQLKQPGGAGRNFPVRGCDADTWWQPSDSARSN